ncbi:MAG: acyltransferase family protein, partial [Acidimicrobiia bacterium]|nr:acyltransferase family protein [Acidimicrobiia bacterium]
MSARARIPHVPALDGIRGAAVAAVLVFHAEHFSGGFLGVDLFFTLSGFLITSLLIAEWRGAGAIQLSTFWARRARRLLPAVLAVIAVVGLYAVIWAHPTELERIRGDGLAALFYFANWHEIWSGRSYFANYGPPSPFEHMWSLAIEEQFYVVWPLLVFVMLRWRKSVTPLLVLTAVATAASLAAMLWLQDPHDGYSRVYFGSDPRASASLLGALAALLVAQFGHIRGPRGRLGLEAAAVAALVALLWAWSHANLQTAGLYSKGGLFACGVGAAVIILAVSNPRPGPLSRLLAFPPLRWMGLISYGLYLWHWPIYVLLSADRTGLAPAGWALVALRVAASLATAVVSYYLIEQPIRRGALPKKLATVAVPLGFGLAAASIVGFTVGAVSLPTSSLLAGGTNTAPPAGPPASGPPTTAVPGAPAVPSVFIAGDSVGFTVAQGLLGLPAGTVTVSSEARFGCGLARWDGDVKLKAQVVSENADGQCHAWPNRWTAALATNHPADAVLVLGAWDVADHKLDGKYVHPCQSEFDSRWQGEADEAMKVLGSSGARVDVVLTPHLRNTQIFPLSKDEQDQRVDCLNRMLRDSAQRAGANVLDLASFVCPASCEDKGLRPDGVHYDGTGGPQVARWLLDQLAHLPSKAGSSGLGRPTQAAAPPPTTTPSPSPTVASEPSVPAAPTTAAVVAANAALPPGRPATFADPLRVLTVGDSQMFDLTPGIAAALTSTGAVKVGSAAFGGFGLSDNLPWRTVLSQALRDSKPDVVVAMWAGWDYKLPTLLGAAGYQARLDEAITLLHSG